MCAERPVRGFIARTRLPRTVPARMRARVWILRGAAAVLLVAGLGDLARVMWALPWPVDAVAALGVSAAWTAWIGEDATEG